ncbi:hypothetical protein [Paraburkholderia sp. BCC1886]|uniref:hypothetical protein n=1 Tax=Paraburkholderia sp. BCC1886 TaxID=2562670 RepID=UPI001182E3B2|nr:hypothetical protein [Paraburkholderia sp. BCC1886]
MTLQSSGVISMSDINTEIGGAADSLLWVEQNTKDAVANFASLYGRAWYQSTTGGNCANGNCTANCNCGNIQCTNCTVSAINCTNCDARAWLQANCNCACTYNCTANAVTYNCNCDCGGDSDDGDDGDDGDGDGG